MYGTIILICRNLSVGEVMNAICEAQLCQFVVVLQKVLKLFYFHRLLLTWSWAGLHCGQLSIYMASLVFKYSQKIPNTLVRTLFLSAAGKQARKY